MVVGQTVEEHDAYVQGLGRQEARTRKGTKLNFKFNGEALPPPQLEVPHFPHFTSWDGDDLIEKHRFVRYIIEWIWHALCRRFIPT